MQPPMTLRIDLIELASEIAEIARSSQEPSTAGKLWHLANRLLAEAGLPDDEKDASGGLSPLGWLN